MCGHFEDVENEIKSKLDKYDFADVRNLYRRLQIAFKN